MIPDPRPFVTMVHCVCVCLSVSDSYRSKEEPPCPVTLQQEGRTHLSVCVGVLLLVNETSQESPLPLFLSSLRSPGLRLTLLNQSGPLTNTQTLRESAAGREEGEIALSNESSCSTRQEVLFSYLLSPLPPSPDNLCITSSITAHEANDGFCLSLSLSLL